MEIDIKLTTRSIPGQISPPLRLDQGAWVEFRGIVRGEEEGQPIEALDYEAYSPMAERELRRIVEDLASSHHCLAIQIIHRTGTVPVGEAAIYVGIAGRHRSEAFEFLAKFMDRLKQDVPIWKTRARPSKSEPVPDPGGVGRAAAPPPKTADGSRPASANEVLAMLHQLCRPLEPERVPLGEALGRVLREPVRATEDQPCFDRSSVDGYATLMNDAGAEFRIVDEIRAGEWKPRTLVPGEAVRIATGAAVPAEGLRVVMREDVVVEGRSLTLLRRETSRNIRFRGEDARAGQVLVDVGTVLQSGALGLLASVGCCSPLVTRRPAVLHLMTGNELVPPSETPGRGQIRDSNSTLVRAYLATWGVVLEQHRTPEDEAALRAELARLPAGLDLLLVSGGASVGEHDFTRRLLEEAGFTIHVRKIAARPGKPLIVARRGGTLAFGLPGNPLAHFVCLNLYVRAALEAWAGQRDRPMFQTGTLTLDVTGADAARETFWPAEWRLGSAGVALTPLPWSSSGDLTAMATANALIRVAAESHCLARGCQVEFVPIQRLF